MELQRVNLRGKMFLIRLPILKKILKAISTESLKYLHKDNENEYFFDKDPKMFNAVLDYYANGSFHLPTYICSVQAREELLFWGIDKAHIQDCCLKSLYGDDLENYNDLKTVDVSHESLCSISSVQECFENDEKSLCKTRMRLWQICDKPGSCYAGKIWAAIIVLNTVMSIFVYGLNTTRYFRTPRNPRNTPNITMHNSMMRMFIETENSPTCVVLDITCNSFLFLDLVIRFIVCPKKKRFFLCIGTISEIIAIAAAIAILIADKNPTLHDNSAMSQLLVVVGVLYSTRVIRILRVVGLFKEVQILYLCIRKCSRDLFLLIVTFLSFSLIFGAAMFWAEFRYTDMFYNYFISVWWAVVTMTTVGYGQHYPSTVPAYIVGSITAIFGLLIIALPVAILSSTFNTYYNCYKYKKRHTRK